MGLFQQMYENDIIDQLQEGNDLILKESTRLLSSRGLKWKDIVTTVTKNL